MNDWCGKHYGINLCYGGGVGYGTYGKAGWDRRSRVIDIRNGGQTVVTWKRLDNASLSSKDEQILYDVTAAKNSN